MKSLKGSLLILLLVAAAPAALGADWFVDQTNCPATGDGSPGNPFCRIQSAAGVVGDGDTVTVAPGTYAECISFAVPTISVTLIAEDPDAHDSIIDASTVVLCDGFPTVRIGGPSSRFEGFTVTGSSDAEGVRASGNIVITNNIVEFNDNSSQLGGGIYWAPANCNYGDLVASIDNNIVRNNTADEGGGIYINATPDIGGGCIPLGNPDVTVTNNDVNNNRANFNGGGIVGFTFTPTINESARVAITNNMIDSNEVADLVDPNNVTEVYGGGIFVTTFGYGTETIEIDSGNQVTNNISRGFGGGIFAEINTVDTGDKTIIVDGNDVTENATVLAGGGLDLRMLLGDLSPGQSASLQATGNTVAGNSATGVAELGGGGGIAVSLISTRSVPALLDFTIADNTISCNVADFDGGGAEIRVEADSDPDDQPTAPSTAALNFRNNLVADNVAVNSIGDSVGGGVFLLARARGNATSTLNFDLNTVSDNRVQAGSGGIELEVEELPDDTFNIGTPRININSSIVSDNENFGIGGPGIGSGGIFVGSQADLSDPNLVEIVYTDAFANTANYESSVGDRTAVGGANNISVDPLLDLASYTPDTCGTLAIPSAASYVPEVCSPTLDAADPVFPIGNETGAHRGIVNMGHTGGTALARAGLADINGDGIVDGIDVLRLATAFGTLPGQNRYNTDADLDRITPPPPSGNIIDGVDLGFIGADFGMVCP